MIHKIFPVSALNVVPELHTKLSQGNKTLTSGNARGRSEGLSSFSFSLFPNSCIRVCVCARIGTCTHTCVCVCVLVNICLLVIYRRKTGVKKSSGTSIMILSPYFKGGTNIVTQHNESSD